MPDLYKDVEEKDAPQSSEEQEMIKKLFEYTEEKNNPWRLNYVSKTLRECYNFKELRQWEGPDEAQLNSLDVPAIPIDRINRGLETIDGIRENTGSSGKVSKRELGDERVAKLLDLCKEYVEYTGGYGEVEDDAFDNLKDVGIGISKVGFDPKAGEGEIWFENCDIEDLWYKPGKKKDLSDAAFFVHHQMMDWEDAMMIEPARAGEIKGLKTLTETEWEKIKSGAQGRSAAVDYNQGDSSSVRPYQYDGQVHIWEFWLKRRIPLKRIGSIQFMATPDGQMLPMPQIRVEQVEYTPQGDEQELGTFVQEEWNQFIVATSGEKRSGLLLKRDRASDHPFVGMCSERKKDGSPRGYIEISIPHQRRLNLAWAQERAFYNKAIKSPIITSGTEYKFDEVIHATRLGSMLHFPTGTNIHSINAVPNINVSAIQEMAAAKQDMDFAASATEGALRGVSEPSASGIKLSLQQNAAVTPLNKWMKALKLYQQAMGRKVLKLIIQHYSPERMRRIVGDPQLMKIVIGEVDPMTGQPTQPPLQLPLQLDVANYDVTIEDKSISDFNKQQAFNATEALVSGGVLFDDEYRIRNAPIRNIEEALASNEKKRKDVIQMLTMQVQILEQQLGEVVKQIPKGEGNQRGNAVRGRNQPQAGQRSMLGGARMA